MSDQKIIDIKIRDIIVADENVRQTEPDKDLQELADSIRKHGQLQPVVLRGEFDKPKYELIIGQRRFLAIKQILKYDTIKATFAPIMTDVQAKIASLAENMCRVELSYKDAAEAITALYEFYKKDDERVAKETGLSVRKVRQYIRIEERASDKTKKKLRANKVKPVDVHRALQAASDDVHKADELLELMEKYKLDSHQKKRVVAIGLQHPRASAEEIVKKARPPVLEQSVVVRLPDHIRQALDAAAGKLAMAPDELAAKAVEEWLLTKGFVR